MSGTIAFNPAVPLSTVIRAGSLGTGANQWGSASDLIAEIGTTVVPGGCTNFARDNVSTSSPSIVISGD